MIKIWKKRINLLIKFKLYFMSRVRTILKIVLMWNFEISLEVLWGGRYLCSEYLEVLEAIRTTYIEGSGFLFYSE